MTEIDINFDKSLANLLSQLHKNEWATPLKGLEEKFRQIPDDDSSFRVEVINMLHQLSDALSHDAETPITQLAAIRLSGFNCWTYRFYRDDSAGRHYLDPLTTPASALSGDVSITQSNSPFPATDIIKRWAREHLQ
ncbi:hypothetical protein [Cellvibrio sp. PSBB023]|uniref:hypothetical protein n=1 Tax=Cellvibrio sp. PSBB023 TaxID=1945512 RepID=UPI00098FA83C|nr:hypothetical protein [Cellvibrio sp. PSBB023]AQT61912.1 hypothetical protein B0D95_18720 [Cellvibrio sp. PSBB023]